MATEEFEEKEFEKPRSSINIRLSIIKIFVIATIIVAIALFANYFLPGEPDQRKKAKRGLNISDPNKIGSIPFDSIPYKQLLPLLGKQQIEYMPPAADQNDQGSCVPFSLAYYLVSYYEKMRGGYSYNVVNNVADPSRVFSPAFVYYAIKANNRSSDCESGIDFFDAFSFINKFGASTWKVSPYSGKGNICSKPPSDDQYRQARPYNGYRFYRIKKDLTTIQSYINQKLPVIVGLYSSKKMDIDGYNHTDNTLPFFWNPQANDKDTYHALLCVGYDNDKKCFILLNSWGIEWGNNGYCYVPYDVFYSRAREFYVAKIDRATIKAEIIGRERKFIETATHQLPDSTSKNEQILQKLSTDTDVMFRKDLRELKLIKNKTKQQLELQAQLEKYFLTLKNGS